MIKPRKLTMRQYVELVRDLNSRMAQLPPLFEDIQMLDEYELVDSLANKAPKTHKVMMISQGFNPETADLETFVEHCERAETTDNIAGRSLLPPTNTVSQERKSASSPRMSRVRNARSVPPSFIDLFMERILVTPQGSATSSRQKARKSLSSL